MPSMTLDKPKIEYAGGTVLYNLKRKFYYFQPPLANFLANRAFDMDIENKNSKTYKINQVMMKGNEKREGRKDLPIQTYYNPFL